MFTTILDSCSCTHTYSGLQKCTINGYSLISRRGKKTHILGQLNWHRQHIYTTVMWKPSEAVQKKLKFTCHRWWKINSRPEPESLVCYIQIVSTTSIPRHQNLKTVNQLLFCMQEIFALVSIPSFFPPPFMKRARAPIPHNWKQ